MPLKRRKLFHITYADNLPGRIRTHFFFAIFFVIGICLVIFFSLYWLNRLQNIFDLMFVTILLRWSPHLKLVTNTVRLSSVTHIDTTIDFNLDFISTIDNLLIALMCIYLINLSSILWVTFSWSWVTCGWFFTC